jgi:hypothetical protein
MAQTMYAHMNKFEKRKKINCKKKKNKIKVFEEMM